MYKITIKRRAKNNIKSGKRAKSVKQMKMGRKQGIHQITKIILHSLNVTYYMIYIMNYYVIILLYDPYCNSVPLFANLTNVPVGKHYVHVLSLTSGVQQRYLLCSSMIRILRHSG